MSKPLENVEAEMNYLDWLDPKYIFIRDENFPLQKDWEARLEIIAETGAKIYLFASANLITEDVVRSMAASNVYMVCLGLEDITVSYGKNNHLDEACALLKKYGIYVYLSFIVNPLKIIGREKGEKFYNDLLKRFDDLKPEMVCGNFLMPFKGTKLWDEYYWLVSEDDYKEYDSKSAFVIKNKILRKKMEYFMFHYQMKYYRSPVYRRLREFECGDMLHLRFQELERKFNAVYDAIWDKRA